MLFRCCRYKGMPEEKGLFDFFGNVSDFLKWFYEFVSGAVGSEESNFHELCDEAEKVWAFSKPLRLIPLMMDIQYMLDSPINYYQKAVPTKEAADVLDFDEAFILRKYDEIMTDFLQFVNSKVQKSAFTADKSLIIKNMIDERRQTITDLLYQAKSLDDVCMSSGYKSHLSSMIDLKAKYSDRVYPFLAIDPRRPGIISEVLKGNLVGKGKPFAGIKIYPRLGYMPDIPQMYSIYDFCERNDIPITTHCSQGGFPTADWKYHDYCNPEHYRSLLSNFKKLKINFAHFGYPYNVYDKEYGKDQWRMTIIDLMEKHDNVYTDISCYSEIEDVRQVKNFFWNRYDVLKQRIMFGSDFDVMQATDIITLERYFQNFTETFTEAEINTMSSVVPTAFLNGIFEEKPELTESKIKPTQKRGYCLAIGLNSVDKVHYNGWNGALNCCEKDANDLAKLAAEAGFQTDFLFTKDATRDNVKSAIQKASESLNEGDIFLVYYSGHGGQVENIADTNSDETDAKDETWCLYDGQLIDDELYKLWKGFKPGTRILMISDSCHSGTMVKELEELSNHPETKIMPYDLCLSVYDKNKDFYDSILDKKKDRTELEPDINSSVILISACQDNQTAMAGYNNSVFTYNLIKVWNNGQFEGDYRNFHSKIVRLHPQTQTPNYVVLGARNYEYEAQKPFTI